VIVLPLDRIVLLLDLLDLVPAVCQYLDYGRPYLVRRSGQGDVHDIGLVRDRRTGGTGRTREESSDKQVAEAA
jgi:hypothetical protein